MTRLLPLIEEALREAIEPPDPALEAHYGMMAYHMGFADTDLQPARADAGKRIRPLLCLLTTEAAGGDVKRAMPAAVALELLHNFSLVHDDVEDASPTRRHRPTVWKIWGVPQAINVGDGMFALAHLALERLYRRGVPAEIVLRALWVFDETCRMLTEGQHLDLAFEARDRVSEDEYLQMIAGKTGALLATSVQLGALVAGAGPEEVAAYEEFGWALGRAFQIRDDILGIWGDEAVTGKSARSDILSRKKSLPVVHALAQESEAGRALRAIYARPEITPEDVPEVLRWLEEAGSRAYAEAMVQEALSGAEAALARARPLEPAAAALRELMDALARRTY
ncbi:MAG: polyprenyl synthetase family protein [Chloroflexi bacterium]|nr:polyprenyl synthetase family protein [Chloroflexota bacterium]